MLGSSNFVNDPMVETKFNDPSIVRRNNDDLVNLFIYLFI